MPLPGHPLLSFRLLPASDVSKAAALETAGYPADEAASPAALEYRQKAAPELFYGVYTADDELVAFVVSTAANGETMEEEAMSTHVVGGESVCIHSVCVASSHHRKGIALAMVTAYVKAIAINCGSVKRLLLMAHAPLLGLYARCGFEFLGPSAVTHGSEQWFDMRFDCAVHRHLDFVQVDAFTSKALAGNPAAVLFTQRGGDNIWMQAVAVENNLSETAFLEQRDTTNCQEWDICWFTPNGEVALCGHATLGASHALWETERIPRTSSIIFHTRTAGKLTCSISDGWIKMDFPGQPVSHMGSGSAVTGPCAELAAALGISHSDVHFFGKGPKATPDWLLEVSPSAFGALAPDFSAIARVQPMDRGVVVTCAGGIPAAVTDAQPAKRPRVLEGSSADLKFDFSSRSFFPTLGVNEDPVCGSAHCILTPYWAQRLSKGVAPMVALQASPRGGILRVQMQAVRASPDQCGRVNIQGQAVTVLRGRMAV